MSVKVGIVGAGFIGRIHAVLLKRDPRVELVGIADTNPVNAERLAHEVGSTAVDGLEGIISAGATAVFICTPNVLHVEPVTTALGAGLHVFSEKPMATTLEGARTIRDAAAKAKGMYQIGFNRRFSNVYGFAKQRIADGRIVPRMAQMKHNRGELRNPVWTGDVSVTGGFLYETPVHLFDMARFLFGDVKTISGMARQSEYAELDGFALTLAFENGIIATITTVAHVSWLFPTERVEIYGSHKSIVTEELERASFSTGAREQAEGIECLHMPFDQKWGYVVEDTLFIDAVLNGGKPAVTAEDGYKATELVEAAYRAVRTGQTIALPL
jgi:myo-inositol 2-dehydrogenase/D-chiro-inositol 1-dehydrogenase